MHEVGIMQSILSTALQAAEEEGAESIEVIRLRVGQLMGVVPEALDFAFECLKPGTPAENGRLEVDYIIPEFECAGCGVRFQAPQPRYDCPACSGTDCRMVKGRELEVVNLDVR